MPEARGAREARGLSGRGGGGKQVRGLPQEQAVVDSKTGGWVNGGRREAEPSPLPPRHQPARIATCYRGSRRPPCWAGRRGHWAGPLPGCSVTGPGPGSGRSSSLQGLQESPSGWRGGGQGGGRERPLRDVGTCRWLRSASQPPIIHSHEHFSARLYDSEFVRSTCQPRSEDLVYVNSFVLVTGL